MLQIYNNILHADLSRIIQPKLESLITMDKLTKNTSIRNIYIQVEPESILPIENKIINNYKDYDFILSFNDNILNKCPNSYKYIFGMTFLNLDDVKNIDISIKKFNMSCVTGDKLLTIGHKFRHDIFYRQLEINSLPTTFYISGFSEKLPNINNNPKILRESNNKIDIFKESQFSLVIENSRQKNYFTEKICDCILTKTIPIYYGCPNISEYFDVTGWIILNNESVDELISKLSILTSDYYMKYINIIEKNAEIVKQYVDITENINRALNTIKDY
jgi:hypothetical protein